jgi:hypothetical protein
LLVGNPKRIEAIIVIIRNIEIANFVGLFFGFILLFFSFPINCVWQRQAFENLLANITAFFSSAYKRTSLIVSRKSNSVLVTKLPPIVGC